MNSNVVAVINVLEKIGSTNKLSQILNPLDGEINIPFQESKNDYYNFTVSKVVRDESPTKGEYFVKEQAISFRAAIQKQFVVYNPLKYSCNKQFELNDSLITAESYMEYATGSGRHGEMLLYRFSDKGTLKTNNTYNYQSEMEYAERIKADVYIFGLPKKLKVTDNTGNTLREVHAQWNTLYPNQITRIKNVINQGDM